MIRDDQETDWINAVKIDDTGKAIVKVKLRKKSDEDYKKQQEALKDDKQARLFLKVTCQGDDKKHKKVFLEDEGFVMEKGNCCIDITPEMLKEIFPKSKEQRRTEVSRAINEHKCRFQINNEKRLAHFIGQIGTETNQLNALQENYNYSAKTIYNIFLKIVLVPHPTVSGKYTFKYHDLIEGYDTDLTCKYPNATTSYQKNYGHKQTVENPIEVTGVYNTDSKRHEASWDYGTFKESYAIKSNYVNSKTLFDYVYGCRMENGNKSTQDGSDYFGVGFIHLTGKDKYKYLDDEWKKQYPDDPKDFMGDDIALLKTDVDVAMRASMIIWNMPEKKTNTKCDKGIDDETIASVTKDVNGGYNGLPDRKKYTKKAYEVITKSNKS